MEKSYNVSKKQRQVIDALLCEDATIEEVLDQYHVTKRSFFSWLANPAFQGFMAAQTRARTDAVRLTAWRTLMRGVEKGETSAIKLFFDLKGKERDVGGNFTVQLDEPAKEAAC